MGAYSGAAARAAHSDKATPVAGYDPAHTDGRDITPEVFEPQISTPSAQTGDIWQTAPSAVHSEMRDEPSHHWARTYPPVPSGIPRDDAVLAWQQRWLQNHAYVSYRPYTARAYTHATVGRSVEYTRGRGPWVAGDDTTDAMSHLVVGHYGSNAYDRLNPLTDVYSADEGRYRLGGLFTLFGAYDQHAKNGQDAFLRAHDDMHPIFPAEKPVLENSQPVIPNSRGIANWMQDAFQRPMSFTPPVESEGTNLMLASTDVEVTSEFYDDARL